MHKILSFGMDGTCSRYVRFNERCSIPVGRDPKLDSMLLKSCQTLCKKVLFMKLIEKQVAI